MFILFPFILGRNVPSGRAYFFKSSVLAVMRQYCGTLHLSAIDFRFGHHLKFMVTNSLHFAFFTLTISAAEEDVIRCYVDKVTL